MNEQTKSNLGIAEDKPTEWFETLYAETGIEGAGVPWANMTPHPIFKKWIDQNSNQGKGKTALVIGCGLGDDAIELENHGFSVTAFDVSASAVALCKKRFPNSTVNFIQADLLKGIPEWRNKFDFVLEIFTIQALPPKYEDLLIKHLSSFVATQGEMLVVTEVRKGERNFENGPPWLLNHSYLKSFENHDLKLVYHSNKEEAHMGEECHLSIFQRTH